MPGAILGTPRAAPARIADLVRDAQAALAETLAVIVANPNQPERVAASLAGRGLETRVAVNWTDAATGGVAVLRMHADEGLRTATFVLLPIGALLRTRAASDQLESLRDVN
jgi:hypothetical protein